MEQSPLPPASPWPCLFLFITSSHSLQSFPAQMCSLCISLLVGLLAKYLLCYLARVFSVVLCHISEQRGKRSLLTSTCGPRFLSLFCVSHAMLSTSHKGLLNLLLFTPTTMLHAPLLQTRKLRHREVKWWISKQNSDLSDPGVSTLHHYATLSPRTPQMSYSFCNEGCH